MAVAGAAIAAGAAAGTAALAALAVQQAQVIDRAGKMAARLGITTQALQAYRFAAREAGATDEILDKSLGFLAKSLGEAKSGVGEAKQVLDKWGISADAIASMPLDEAFELVADRIAATGNASEQAYAASQLFGRGGMELLNMLQQGTGGLDAYRKQLQALGGDFSNIEAKQVENANDAVGRLRTGIEILGQRIAIKVAPVIEFLSAKVLGFVELFGGFEPVVNTIFDAVLRVFAAVKRFFVVSLPNAMDTLRVLDADIALVVSRIWKYVTDTIIIPVLRFFEEKLPRAALGAAEKILAALEPVANVIQRVTGVDVGLSGIRDQVGQMASSADLGGASEFYEQLSAKVAAGMRKVQSEQIDVAARIQERSRRDIAAEMRTFVENVTRSSEERAADQVTQQEQATERIVEAVNEGSERVVSAIDERLDSITGPISQVYSHLSRLASVVP